METLFSGSKDVFLTGIRADFDAVEDQALKSSKAIQTYSLIGSDPLASTLFTMVSDTVSEGSRTVWRHVATTGIKNLGKRSAGGTYPSAEFLRGYETLVIDPDQQDAGEFVIPEEREAKESAAYKETLNRAKKLLLEIDRKNIADVFEVFNLAQTAPASYPGDSFIRFFARGNKGTDANNTALGERLASTSHARVDGGTSQSNTLASSDAFDTDVYWNAKVAMSSIVDDVGKPFPTMGGRVAIVTAPYNVKLAKQVQESDWEVGLAENQINIHKGMFNRIISSPYLNQSYYDATNINNERQWALVDEENRDTETGTGLVCVSFWPLSTNVERVNGRDAVAYTVKQNKVYGFTDFRSVYYSNGSGIAFSS